VEASTLEAEAWTFEAEAWTFEAEAWTFEAFTHLAIEEIKIRCTSGS